MDEVAKMKVKLETACSDEERAKKQLVKLQLIVNEIHVKIGHSYQIIYTVVKRIYVINRILQFSVHAFYIKWCVI